LQDLAEHRLFHPVGNGIMADSQEAFGGALADAFKVLRQSGRLGFRGHTTAVFFAEGFFAFRATPTLMAVAGGSILDAVNSMAVRAVHAKSYRASTSPSIPILQSHNANDS
jgi:hypothetical protein